jgi:hypothetical protein
MSQPPDNRPENLGVMSPFDSARRAGAPPPSPRPPHFQWALAGVGAAIVVLAVAIIVVLVWKRTVDNPYRTLETFPAERYFERPQALLGNRFRAIVRVEGDLGWTPSVGKLMVFSVENDPRYLPVLVTGDSQRYAFSKGQTYLAQLEVKDRGLIVATDLRKN